jgi:hypothetical protein
MRHCGAMSVTAHAVAEWETTMLKLTYMQQVVLAEAAAREDGAVALPDKLNRTAAQKLAGSLVGRKLMREVRPKPGMPVWRKNELDQPISLVITRAGRDVIETHGPVTSPVPAEIVGPFGQKSRPAAPKREAAPRIPSVASKDAEDLTAKPAGAPRSGSKQSLVLQMLSNPGGTTLEALIVATGWLPHTTRAALSGLRKRGFAIERFRQQGSEVWNYMIVNRGRTAA